MKEPRFSEIDSGIVRDSCNQLEWQKTTAGFDPSEEYHKKHTWQEAIEYCSGLTLGGHKDWRLPTCHELQTLVDYSRFKPAIDTAFFPDTLPYWYWSSTPDARNEELAWIVHFYYGYVYNSYKTYKNCIRAVRVLR